MGSTTYRLPTLSVQCNACLRSPSSCLQRNVVTCTLSLCTNTYHGMNMAAPLTKMQQILAPHLLTNYFYFSLRVFSSISPLLLVDNSLYRVSSTKTPLDNPKAPKPQISTEKTTQKPSTLLNLQDTHPQKHTKNNPPPSLLVSCHTPPLKKRKENTLYPLFLPKTSIPLYQLSNTPQKKQNKKKKKRGKSLGAPPPPLLAPPSLPLFSAPVSPPSAALPPLPWACVSLAPGQSKKAS